MTLRDEDLRIFIAKVVGMTEDTWPVAWLLARFIQDDLRVGYF